MLESFWSPSKNGVKAAGQSRESELLAQRAKGDVTGPPVEEPVAAEGVGIVALRIHRGHGVDLHAGIEEQPDVLAVGPAPGLHERGVVERRVRAHARHACVDKRLGAGPLDAARQRVVFRILGAQVQEPPIADRQADVARQQERLLAFVELAVLRAELAPLVGVAGHEVDDARDGIRAVLGGGAVAQHLDPLESDRGQHADVGALRALAGGRHELRDHRRAVAALAVHHHHASGRAPGPAARWGERRCRHRPTPCWR